MRPFSNVEWNTLPHVIMTSNTEWDPSSLDNNIDEDEWFNAKLDYHEEQFFDTFDPRGEYKHISTSADLHTFIMEHKYSNTEYTVSSVSTSNTEAD